MFCAGASRLRPQPSDCSHLTRWLVASFQGIARLHCISLAFYWLFANSATPNVMGMPFGMFFIALFIGIEFAVLVILYFLEAKDTNKGGDA